MSSSMNGTDDDVMWEEDHGQNSPYSDEVLAVTR
jgi:hypothetical protein